MSSSKKIKILHVLNSNSWGGLEQYTVEFIHHLNQLDLAENYLLCPKHSILSQRAKSENISVTHSWSVLFKNWNIYHVHQRQDLIRVRLALLFNPKAKFFYSLMMNAPNKNRLHHFWIYRRLDYLFSSSKTIVEQVKNNFPVRESTPQWLPYGRSITEESFSSSEIDGLRSRYGVTTETFVVGTLCRIDRGKGVLELAGALKHLPQSILEKIQIWIIGDPTVKSTIDNRVVYEEDAEKVYNELLKIKKSFPNQLQLIPYQKKAGLFLKSMDAFVLASHNETYSLSVLEAMIYEVLILGSRSGGTIEQIGFDELRGCFFEPRSELSIASQIEKVMSSPKLREKKIKEAKKWVTENHSWSNNLKMFRELLAKKQIYV